MDALKEIIKDQIQQRLVEEGIDRVISCVEKLTLKQLHYTPNSNSNSIVNLILHLDGNVRQWLLAGVFNHDDTRDRNSEFAIQKNLNSKHLLQVLEQLREDVVSELQNIEAIDLSEKRNVQCYNETILSMIIHVIEHFSYHTGQITYITKMLLDIDTKYYDNLDLDQTN